MSRLPIILNDGTVNVTVNVLTKLTTLHRTVAIDTGKNCYFNLFFFCEISFSLFLVYAVVFFAAACSVADAYTIIANKKTNFIIVYNIFT